MNTTDHQVWVAGGSTSAEFFVLAINLLATTQQLTLVFAQASALPLHCAGPAPLHALPVAYLCGFQLGLPHTCSGVELWTQTSVPEGTAAEGTADSHGPLAYRLHCS